MGRAADGLLDRPTGAYRDPEKWAHLMVEADLELYRSTRDERYLKRAVRSTDHHYGKWKQSPAPDLITQASLARDRPAGSFGRKRTSCHVRGGDPKFRNRHRESDESNELRRTCSKTTIHPIDEGTRFSRLLKIRGIRPVRGASFPFVRRSG